MGIQTVAEKEGVAAARAAAPPLPCLFTNNSDSDGTERPEIRWADARDRARYRKAAHALAANVEHFVERYGVENVGFFTITFPKEVRTYQEAHRRYDNFARRVLAKLFGDRIRVLEAHADGRPHYHLLVDCMGDIRSGFDWEYYAQVKNWNRGLRAEKPSGNLGRSVHLKALHDALREAAERYGVGRMELTPIRSCSEAVGRYVGGYIAKGAIFKDERYKGARSVSYSQSFDRKVKGAFSWVEDGRKWREAVASWARSHGCADLEQVKAVFGPRWVYHHSDEILRHGEKPIDLPEWAMPAKGEPHRTEPRPTLATPPAPAGRGSSQSPCNSPDEAGTLGNPEPGTIEGTAVLKSRGQDDGGGGARPARTGAGRIYVLTPESDFAYKTRNPRVHAQRSLPLRR